ncbi:MAG: linked oxidase domain protein [Gemmatimonadetes bacterium]|nr:linked oxidase domain protein [Gemmatimonadota bacterium]
MTPLSPPDAFRGAFRTDDDARAVYSEAAGIARIAPRAVAVPVDVDDLRALVRWAESTRTPLIPRGSGSSMPSGAIGDGVIVDLSRWRTIGVVDTSSRTVRVGPGALRAEVDRTAREQGLRFPVDPSSGAFCTVGGMASTNAAGSHSMYFGSMRRWVRAVDCVFADGSRAEVRRGVSPPTGISGLDQFLTVADRVVAAELRSPSSHRHVIKDSSGYGVAAYARSRELVDLLVGSEGTLVFFVELELDLVPVAAATSSVLGAFATIEAAVTAAGRARAAGAVACELLDRTFLDVAASGGAERQVPAETESALLAEVEGADPQSAAEAAKRVEEIFRAAGATTVRIALDHATETELWELRHAASPILARLDPALKSMQFVEDCAVPPENLPAYVRGVRAILSANDTRGVIFGHAGDAHVHVNPLVDVSRADWRARVQNILDAVVALTASLGGTLTGEHGDGRLRTPLLPRVWPEEAIEHFREVKRAFDPLGILNPGVKVALPGESALGDIKYDPSLPPLPARARAALDVVERERGYAHFRLDLLDDAG